MQRLVEFALVSMLLLSSCAGDDESVVPAAPTVQVDTRASSTSDPLSPAVGTTDLDVQHYRWELTVDPSTGQLLQAVASLDAVVAAPLDEITLDYRGPAITSVAVDDRAVDAERTATKLIIDHPGAEGDVVQVAVKYQGLPTATTLPGAGRFGWITTDDGIYTTTVLPGHLATWVPLNDSWHDVATFDISVTVPEPYVAVASGTKVSSASVDGQVTYRYRTESPANEVTVAVGRFTVTTVADAPVHIDVALPEDTGRLDAAAFDDTPEMVEFLTEWLGPLPFGHIGFTHVHELGPGGDSTPGRINVGSAAPDLLVHELTHQWMGGTVSTASPVHSWLQEGLPTYMEILWLDREGLGTVEGSMAARRRNLGPTTRAPLDFTSPGHRSDRVTYDRGALVFHALHERLGDAGFRKVLHHFFATHAGQAATSHDFITAATDASGQELAEFFDRWLTEPTVPADTN